VRPEENGNGSVFLPEEIALVVHTIPAMITYIDSNRNIRFINKAVEKTFGVSASRVVGRHLSHLIGEAGYERVREYIVRALRGERVHYEVEVPLPIGNRFIEATYTPHFDTNGEVKGYIALVNDITEKKETERELERKRRELQDYVENAPVGLHWVDDQGRIIWANEAEMNMLGYQPEEYIGHHIAEFHADQATIDDILSRLRNGETLREYEATLKCRDGEIKTVLINSNVFWEDEKFVHTRCFTTDISERKKLMEALQKSESNYREIFAQAPLAISIYLGPEYRTEYVNDLALKIVDRRREELLRRPILEVFPELEAQGFRVALDRVYGGEKIMATEQHIKFFRNGELKEGWFNYMLEPFRDAEGRIRGIICMSADVSEQVLARKHVEASEKKYRQLVESMPLAMYSCDREGRITFFNEVAVRLWGYRPELNSDSLKFCACYKVWLPDGTFVSPEETPMAVALRSGRSFRNVEAKVQRPDGEYFYASVNIDPLFNDQGEVIGAINIFEDITERKNSENELRKSEAFNRTILENSPDCYKILDTEGRLLYMNRRGQEMIGIDDFSAYHLRGWPDFFEGEYRERAVAAVRKAKAGEIVQMEASSKDATGTERWWHIIISPVSQNGNEPTTLIAVSRDITGDKLRAQALEESERRYRSLIQGLPTAVYTCDANGYVDLYNDKAVELWGRVPKKGEKWCGSFKLIDVGDGSQIELEDCLMAVAVKEGKASSGAEVIIERPDGSRRYVNPYPHPIFDAEGKVAGAVNVIVDITEQKLAQKAKEESEGNYQKLLESLPVAVYTCDARGYVQLYNDKAVELWGRRPESGKELWCGSWKIFRPDGTTEVPLSECPMAIAIVEQKPVRGYEIIVERPDGGRRHIIPYPQPLFNSTGEMTGAVNVLVDITEQKQIKKALQESELRYRNLIHGLPAAIYTTDADGVITMYNQAAVQLWGRAPELGKDLWCGSLKIYDRDGITEIPLDECPMAVALKEKRKVTVKEPFIVETPTGERKWFLPHPEPVFDSNGNMTGAVNMLFDVTEHKRAEEQSGKLAAIVQSSEDAIFSMNLEGIVTSWNPAAERLYGYSAEEIIGRSFRILMPDESHAREEIERIRKGELIRQRDVKRMTRDGRLIDVSLSVSPIRDSSGQIIGISKIARDISEQKRLNEELREKEEGLRMAMESANLGTWEYNPVTFRLSCSRESCRICGIPEGMEPSFEVILQHIFEEDQPKFIEEIKLAIKSVEDGKFDMLIRIRRYDNQDLRWVRAKGKVFFGADRLAVRLIGTMMDVTEEKEAEQLVRNSEERLKIIADNVPAMIWMSGNDSFNDYFNNTWLEFTGRTLQEESNEGWLENVHPDDVQRCIHNYNESFRLQKGVYTEYRLRRYDGQYRWIADNSVPRYNAKGEFTGFISACMDIDDQKRFREKIRDSELLFKTISNASPTGLWMTDADGQNVFVNDTWVNWTGKSFEEQLDEGWLSSVVEEDKENASDLLQECARERRYYKTEFRFRRSDGEIRWGLTEGYPYYDSNGQFAGYAGSVTDITELKKLEERKDDFIKMASHELKTPITSINGYVQLLVNIYNELDDEKIVGTRDTVRSSLQTISKQVNKLTRLISELLDLSRIESGQLKLNKREFALGELVEEVAQDARQTTTRHAVLVHNDFSGTIVADRDRIAQVILNLLTNAIKYSPDSNSIEVFVERNEEHALVRVKDTGIGIDRREHQKIFERFYRVEGRNEQTYPGFGIGLFISNEIVQRHNGRILLESEKGKGSVFTMSLPLN